MSIRSVAKRQNVSGLQGSVSFDNTNPNADAQLFSQLKKFMQSDLALGGAGGPVANKSVSPKQFQQTNVFSSPAERDAVAARMNKGTDEHLQELVGTQATAQGMSIPEYLQTRGIHGVGFKNNDLIKASQNPLRGSTEKKISAFMRMRGNTQSVGGGTGEGRQHTGYYSPEDYKHVRSILTTDARRLNMGTGNVGEMEGLYLPAAKKDEVRTLQKITQNERATKLLADGQHPMMQKMKAESLKKYQTAQLKEQADDELRAEGLLPPKKEEDKSGSGKGVVAKGAAVAVAATQNTVSKIANMVGSMLGFLKKISMDMGKLIKDSAEVGIDINTADKMRKWGIGNTTYTGGNEFALLDAVKAFNSKAGDVTRVGNVDFDNMAFQGYGHLIKGVVESSVNQNPMEGTKTIFNSMASSYMTSDNKLMELKKQISALTAAFGSDFANGYSAMLQSSVASGRINKSNAGNMWDINMSAKNIDGLQSIGGSNVNEFIPGAAGAMDLAGNTKMLNDVLGDIGKIQNALYMMLLSNMDIIIQILLGISKGILGIMARFDVKGAAEGLERLTKAEAKMATKGQINLDTNVAKAEVAAKAEIKANLRKKGLEGDELDAMTEKAFLGGTQGDLSGIPEKYRGAVTGSVATKLAVYNTGKKMSKEGYNDTMHGSFWTSGLLGNLFQDSASEQRGLLSKLGLGEYNAQQGDISSIEKVKLDKTRQLAIKGASLGIGASKEESMSNSMRFAIKATTGYLPDQDIKYGHGLYPEYVAPMKPLMLKPGAADSDLKGLPFFPDKTSTKGKLKEMSSSYNYGGLFGDLAQQSMAMGSSSATQASLIGANGEPVVNRLEIDLLQNGLLVKSNIVDFSLNDKKQATKSFQANLKSPVGMG